MKAELFAGDKDNPTALQPAVGEFPQLPRIGEYLSIDRDGYFEYYRVVEVWHRCDTGNVFQPCLRVVQED